VNKSVRARIRTYVRRILRRYGYPPDEQEQAIQTLLQQAAMLWDW
jgi:type I restriction enzyme, R subunit